MRRICANTAKYRTLLHRTVAESGPSIAWVLLNPSVADERNDDPTVRRVLEFSRRAHFATVTVANLFTLRATQPRDLLAALRTGVDAIGPGADHALAAATQCDAVVMAWGRPANLTVRRRADAVADLLTSSGRPLLRIGPPLSDGHPRHPLYAPYAHGLCPVVGPEECDETTRR